MQSVEEHVESEQAVVRPTPKASQSCSSSRPYPSPDATQSENMKPGEASATAANPEPAQPEDSKAEPNDGPLRSKRARYHSGYYADLHKGKK